MDSNTIRILTLAGGGTRGELHRVWLELFVDKYLNGDGNNLWKYFDIIAGTSIGGILALSYAFGKSPKEMGEFFQKYSKRIFTTRNVPIGINANSDSSKPSFGLKVEMIVTKDPFYLPAAPIKDGVNTYSWDNDDWDNYSNYGSNILHDVLCKNFNDKTLQDLKTRVIIPAVCRGLSQYVYFSNIQEPEFHKPNAKIVDVARATSAAPVYLPEYRIDGVKYSDGGTFANFPAETAIAAGYMIKPLANRLCILGLGTGQGESGFQSVDDEGIKDTDGSGASRIFSLFEEASTGAQAVAEFNLNLKKKTFLQENSYQYNPFLDSKQDTELDSSSPKFLKYMKDKATEDFLKDEINIFNFYNKFVA